MNLKLDHINLTVNDFKESALWYKKVFDFDLLEIGETYDARKWGIVGKNDIMICMTELGKSSKSPEWPSPKSPNSQGPSMNHFGLRVSERELWEKTLKVNALKLYYGGINEYPHSVSWYVKDPNGHTIEVSYTEKNQMEFPPLDRELAKTVGAGKNIKVG